MKRKRTKRGACSPRWLVIDGKCLYLYSVDVVVKILRRHRWVVIGWLELGLIPSFKDRRHRYWLPEFAVTRLKTVMKDANFAPGKMRTEGLKNRLRKEFQVKGPVYVY